MLVSTTLSTAKNLRWLVGLKRSVLSSFCVDIHPGLQTGVDVNAGKTEIRPGLSNVLYLMSRLAPSLPFGQMAKMMHTAS